MIDILENILQFVKPQTNKKGLNQVKLKVAFFKFSIRALLTEQLQKQMAFGATKVLRMWIFYFLKMFKLPLVEVPLMLSELPERTVVFWPGLRNQSLI